jgi:hypothetical protein
MATKAKTKPAGPADRGLEVTARRESFWRAGLQFTREARVVPLAELTPEQADAIRTEGDGGQLVVSEVDIAPAKA